jgi:energy-coupling factor transport system ATP-binding protein
MEILACKNLTFTYPDMTSPTVSEVSFSCQNGDILLLMGQSGCGKTTLLRLLKPEIAPVGRLSGEITCADPDSIGFVMQNPDSQTVTDRVLSELCFTAENLGLSREIISRRLAETVSFFGIERLLDREISTLSGGEKQLVNLCSAMMAYPEILILDEPTSCLDPVAAEDFLSCLLRLNRELGTTLIISSHSPDVIFGQSTAVLLMEKGRLLSVSPPRQTALAHPEMSDLFPAAAAIFLTSCHAHRSSLPLDVREGKSFLLENYTKSELPLSQPVTAGEEVLSCKNLYFRYSRSSKDVVKSADFTLRKGEFFSILGANGAGKSTFLKCMGGLLTPWEGKITLFGKKVTHRNPLSGHVSILPQNPYDLFTEQSVIEDMSRAAKILGKSATDVEKILQKLSVSHLKDTHPYDLSGGEAQLCALARILLTDPEILLLDEPAKGLDKTSARVLGKLLTDLAAEGKAILCVTHNADFAAEFSHRCGMFFDGQIIGTAAPREFFSHNRFYTTAAARICENIFDGAVTVAMAKSEISRQDGLQKKECGR